ncbi:MAG: DotG/IcmE/VirB10 family protein [Trinickia sp.]|uniref:DotG/IcmE/VirB10 family protein n=1 Tax=Trinickia sp. TaxID=2571163 RepID=UPI003F7EE2BE
MADQQRRKMHPGFLRNAKIIAVIAVLAAVCVAVAFFAMRRRSDKAPEIDVPAVSAQGGTPQAETQRYSQTLNQANKEGLAQAQKTGATFIPAFSDRNAQIEKVLADRASEAAAQPEKIDYQHPNGLPPGQSAPASQQPLPSLPSPTQGVGLQVQQLVNQWDNPPQSQEVLGLQKEAQGAASSRGALSSADGAGAAQAVAATQTKPATIHSSDRFYAHLENAIDTDTPSDILAVLDQGPCKGGELMGNGKLSAEAVTATFTSLHCGGKTVAVTAVALNDQTLSNALPADMDHHLMARVAIPALLGALGTAGSVYSNAGSTISNNPLGGTTTIQNPNPSAKQLEGAMVSGGVTGVQGVIQREVAGIPPVTGHVEANTPLIILFKADVVL